LSERGNPVSGCSAKFVVRPYPTHIGPSAFFAFPKPKIHAAALARIVIDCGLGLYMVGFFRKHQIYQPSAYLANNDAGPASKHKA
jgi:hypothetical protein